MRIRLLFEWLDGEDFPSLIASEDEDLLGDDDSIWSEWEKRVRQAKNPRQVVLKARVRAEDLYDVPESDAETEESLGGD